MRSLGLLVATALVAVAVAVAQEEPSPTKRQRVFTEKHLEELLAPWHQADTLDVFQSGYLDPLLVPRVPGTATHAMAKQFIVDTLSGLGWNVTLDAFHVDTTPRGPKDFANIVAVKNPSAPRRIVLAAHYDSKIFDGFEFIGAIDSAGSCALLLFIAAVLNQRLEQQERFKSVTLELLFFDGEEAMKDWSATDSLYGSRHLAALLADSPSALRQKKPATHANKTALDDIDVFILLDLLGAPDPSVYSFFEKTAVMYSRLARNERRLQTLNLLLAKPKHRFLLSVDGQANVNVPAVDDDHRPFLDRGVSVVHLIPLPFPPVWHTVNDKADAIDLPTLLDWGQILASFVGEYLDLA